MAAKVFLILSFKDNDIAVTQSALKQTLTPKRMDMKTAGDGKTLVERACFFQSFGFHPPKPWRRRVSRSKFRVASAEALAKAGFVFKVSGCIRRSLGEGGFRVQSFGFHPPKPWRRRVSRSKFWVASAEALAKAGFGFKVSD